MSKTEIKIEDQKIKIEDKHNIQLGVDLHLMREIHRDQLQSGRVVAKPPEWVRRRRPPSYSDPGGININQEQFKYLLDWGEGEIFIKGQGLCQSYGIFGVPGCGKTYLLRHLLGQMITLFPDDNSRKFGGLILDPKASLMGDIYELMHKAGREKDLIIINESILKQEDRRLNIIDCFLEPVDLGKAMAMAAQSAGISSKEPFWLNELGTIFGAGLGMLHLLRVEYQRKPTLKDLVDILLGEADVGEEGSPRFKPNLEVVIDDAVDYLPRMNSVEAEEFDIYKGVLQRFLHSKDKSVLSSFIDQSYGLFRRPRFSVFSERFPPDATSRSIYDAIIEDGKIVLVSVSKRSLAISKILCTLIKTLFQQTVLTRLDRRNAGELQNFTRPLFFLADEYSDVATELPGQSMGDSMFFSMMRQYGCMGLVATQSVHMLKNSGLGEAWKGIFANMAAKIFMQTGDAETAEEASKLVGESEFRFRTFNRSFSKDGTSQNINVDLKDRKDLPTKILLQTLGRGEAVVIGSTDGKSRPGTYFIMVDGRNREKEKVSRV